MSSTYFLTIWKVISPGFLTAMPSAKVLAVSDAYQSPLRNDSAMADAPAACTPKTWQEGLRLLTAQATPEMRPPPPTGTTTASTPSSWSMISRPMVPWPQITSSSSYGWMRVAPVFSWRRTASSWASS